MTKQERAQIDHQIEGLEQKIREQQRELEERDQMIGMQSQLITQLQEAVTRLEAEVKRLQRQNSKDSHNSSKPPASDGYHRRPRAKRARSEKKTGGQPGHEGHTLKQVALPDRVVLHRPERCTCCACDLQWEKGVLVEQRQVCDLPAMTMEVVEHRVEMVICPHCHHESYGRFPYGVNAPMQYGEQLRALAVYLHQYQMIPFERTCEALEDLVGVEVSEATLATWEQMAVETLEPTIEQIRERLAQGKVLHADETGIRVGGKLAWLHVACTQWLTYLAWHPKRGQIAMREMGIWPRFQGRAMHDRWASYDAFACQHEFCKAHLVRDLTYLAEQEHLEWAAELRDLLLAMHAAAQQWHERGAISLPDEERRIWETHYFSLLCQGYQHLPPFLSSHPQRRGKPKRHPAHNLLDVLVQRAEEIIGFVQDLSRPFTNNQAEQDVRMAKVQQKISGGFRSAQGASRFCAIRSYLVTMRKQGHRAFDALRSIFRGDPLPVAWDGQVILACNLT